MGEVEEITEDNVDELTQWWIVSSGTGANNGDSCHLPKAVIEVAEGDPLDTSQEPEAEPLCNSHASAWLTKTLAQLPPGWKSGGICGRCQNRLSSHKQASQTVSESDGE